jgi:hypothetical protein
MTFKRDDVVMTVWSKEWWPLSRVSVNADSDGVETYYFERPGCEIMILGVGRFDALEGLHTLVEESLRAGRIGGDVPRQS